MTASGFAVFIFRRDLRIVDNAAFSAAVRWCRAEGCKLLTVFMFARDQIDPAKNKYFSHPAVQFMCESLADLDDALHREAGTHLHMYRCNGHTEILARLHQDLAQTGNGNGLKAVFYNKDCSVYARERDGAIQAWCSKHGVLENPSPNETGYIFFKNDYDLVELDEGLLPDGRPYTNLSQYFAKFTKGAVTVRKPEKAMSLKASDFAARIAVDADADMSVKDLDGLYTPLPDIAQRGGRTHGLKILKKIKSDKFADYAAERDFPAVEGTTKASAHLHFGTISVREMYHALLKKKNESLLRELVFRSFYIKIYTSRPELQRGTAFHDAMDKRIPWRSKGSEAGKTDWQAWITGTTGFPLVDAGMRQLAATGWVHNRVRMLVATTATRYFLLDWRDCARFFYSRLVDADTFSNTAGWQWSAGIGPDAAPYFRAPMNPYIQSKKFDPDAVYIKRWVPELANVPAADIHKWDDEKVRNRNAGVAGAYPAPIIGQKEASRRATDVFKKAHAS
jgi:deoxyribodipyrimidine photo-lyase